MPSSASGSVKTAPATRAPTGAGPSSAPAQDGVGPYRVVPFRPERNATLDWLRLAKKRAQIPILLEMDVTDVRDRIRAFRRRTGRGLGFTAWVVSCVARAAAEYPRVHSMWIKKSMGTVVVTATGMASPGVLAWGIPSGLHPLAIGVGGIARRRAPEGDREVLALTVVFDHAVTDGAPVGRYVRRLRELMTDVDGIASAQEDA